MGLQSCKYIFLAYICTWVYFEIVMIDISSAQNSNNDPSRDNNKSLCDELASGKSQCPDGWHVTSNPRTCIKLSETDLPWSKVLETCTKVGGDPVSLYTKDTKIAHQLLLNESITIRDFRKDNYYLKLLPNSITGHGENKTCFGVNRGLPTKLYDCNKPRPFICEINSENGPYTFPEVTIDFPRPNSTAFFNNSLTLRCSSYGPRDQGLTWTARIGIQRVHFQNATIRRVQEMITSGDRCRYYTTVIYDIFVDDYLEGAIITCFSYDTSNKFTCNEILGESYCKSSEPIKAIRGPDRPNLTVNYDDTPATFVHGSIMVFECLGYVALEKVITWVEIHQGRTKVITLSNDSVIELTERTKADPEHGYWMFSLLKIQAHTDLSGIAFACYTEDAILYAKDGLGCPSPHVRCARTDRIIILGTYWSVYKYLLPLLLLFFILIGVLLLTYYPAAFSRGDRESSNASLEIEHPPTEAIDYDGENLTETKHVIVEDQVHIDPVDFSPINKKMSATVSIKRLFDIYKVSKKDVGSSSTLNEQSVNSAGRENKRDSSESKRTSGSERSKNSK